jgi:hypothetical protein
MTLSRLTLTLTALAAVFALAAPAAAGHEIVLNDGTHIEAGTRPVIALGRVNFHDLNGRSRSLSASVVDLDQTRAALRRNGERPQTVWTAADLEQARGQVRLETARAAGTPADGPPEAKRQGSVRRSSTQAQLEVMETALDRVRAQRRMAKSFEPEAEILEERKSVIQSEILRLQTALEIEAEQIAKKR